MFLAMMRILEPDDQSGFFHATPCLGEEGQLKCAGPMPPRCDVFLFKMWTCMGPGLRLWDNASCRHGAGVGRGNQPIP